MSSTRGKAGIYFRDGQGSVGFVLPDEVAAFRMFLSTMKVPNTKELRGKRCWLYARTANDSGNPMALEIQLHSLRLCVDKYSMTVIGETGEVASGLTLDRDGFSKVMDAASDGAFDVLLVKNLSRLARNYTVALEYVKTLETVGVSMVFADVPR